MKMQSLDSTSHAVELEFAKDTIEEFIINSVEETAWGLRNIQSSRESTTISVWSKMMLGYEAFIKIAVKILQAS